MEFIYRAKNQSGELIEGKVDAPNEDQAVNVLQQKGLILLGLEPVQKGIFKIDIFKSLITPSQKDVVIFTRQMATLIDADVPLVEGLYTLSAQVEKESFKRVINTLATSIEGGASLSIALSEHKKVFSEFYISLVRAGEVSGKLQTTLLYLADYLERSAALNSKIKSAMSYPGFVLSALVLVTIILMTTVLPQLLTIIKDAGVTELPLTTKILIGITSFINRFIILIILAIVGGVFWVLYYIKTPAGKSKLDSFIVKMPQFGKIAVNFYLARIAETLSTLIKAGVPILESITITSEVVGNERYREMLLEAKTNVQNGGSISEILQTDPVLFPPLVYSMLAIGEKTGRTDSMLDNIFKFYKSEAENDVQNLSQLIEPVLILLLGLGVGVLVSAILLPIYSLVSGA
jgi:type IV pilus assembly protein PilC